MRKNLSIEDCRGDLAHYHYWKEYKFNGGGYKNCFDKLLELNTGTCISNNHVLSVVRSKVRFKKTKNSKTNLRKRYYGKLKCTNCNKTLDTLNKTQFDYLTSKQT